MAEVTAPLPLPLQGFYRLPPQQKLMTLGVIALVIAAVAGAWMWSRQPSYAVLFSNLSDKDGGAIVAALGQQNVPYKFSEGGGAILVPAGQVHDVRLKLASQGLPKGGSVGFELMDTQKLGVSQFQEQLNYQRGLEGELARSIQSLSAVSGARIHLAIPKSSGFLRDEQKPTASVLVNLHPGRTLDASQVAGIVHLVASSVPQLAPSAVSIVDQNGNLLSAQADASRNAALDPSQLKYVQEVEKSVVRRIEAILTPITGPGNVRAQVTADVDFSQREQTAETFRPNQAPDAVVVRSQQTSETATREPNASGVPGALSNQPPVPATAPITAPAAPGTPGASGSAPLNARKDATINYEVDKTITHTRQASGAVKRLSVAVVVNHKSEPGKDGKPVTRALSEAEIKQIDALVREAMGFDKARGDSLNVANSPFNVPEKEAIPETPLWKNPELIAMGKDAGKFLLFAALAAWAFFGIIKPMIRSLAQRAEAAIEADTAAEEAEAARIAYSTGVLGYDQKLAAAKEMAKQDPKLVASVIKGWVGSNER